MLLIGSHPVRPQVALSHFVLWLKVGSQVADWSGIGCDPAIAHGDQ